ncbi:SDR family NAD(P)-dependent oxidoreductase [Sphingobium sp. HWE2-09]|uniref:SDR family NAD(P)-dependent oxidoreductase n=1 Tax=Sphingobium sp. HWE2-09 TaxID=3108390 RepID=UPI002DC68277|nr:SDR family NAD(P)-dependent oxidoreductase [Sphingobium sp. HWE2-09]
MKLEGKVAVVTGAASGLGLEACRALASGGARIIAFDLDLIRLEDLQKELWDSCLTARVDVADEHSVIQGLQAGMDAFGEIHAAVNCAGVADAAKTLSKGKPFPLDTWNKVVAVNLTGTFNIIRHSAVHMEKNAPDPQTGERGVIINTASGAATQGQMGQAAYSASKAGIIGMTLPIARDLAAFGIRVVSISPGLFATPLVAGLPEHVVESLIMKTVLFPHRMGNPSEFGGLVRHVVENTYLNATTIDLDGGARLTAK